MGNLPTNLLNELDFFNKSDYMQDHRPRVHFSRACLKMMQRFALSRIHISLDREKIIKNLSSVFVHFILGGQLQICPRGLTCCTEEMEKKLWTSTRESYKKAMHSAASSIQKIFNSKANKFDGKKE